MCNFSYNAEISSYSISSVPCFGSVAQVYDLVEVIRDTKLCKVKLMYVCIG